MTEVVVAATLLVSLIGLVAPLAARFGRIWQTTRVYRLGVNELANRMEILTRMDATNCVAAIAEMSCSSAIMQAMPNAKLTGELIQDSDGRRLKLKLKLDQDKLAPLLLVGWLLEKTTEAENTLAYTPERNGDLR